MNVTVITQFVMFEICNQSFLRGGFTGRAGLPVCFVTVSIFYRRIDSNG